MYVASGTLLQHLLSHTFASFAPWRFKVADSPVSGASHSVRRHNLEAELCCTGFWAMVQISMNMFMDVGQVGLS